ncbi:SAM-dependent methyltransferase [Bacillus pumilus]|uniref:SAM-dependent methyltransferase n=1 Tax=Bacillus pumilus TaxID=1408 RepID=A0A2A5IU48_BACPU|nr:class I SAM-dependent methyltransferase [Bacillus pumilus]PCK20517.1 SAM-dependent methyltransferase [Bacillus pumilus]
MQKDQVSTIFELLDTASHRLKKEQSISYIEALAEAGEAFFQANDRNGLLKELIEKADFGSFDHEQIRKAFQLAVLKGQKDISHPNRQMTPDTIGLFVSYLVNKFLEGQKELAVFDPAAGTGNLLLAVLNNLTAETKRGFASEIDDVLIKIAWAQANLEEKEVELFHQDSLEPLLISPADVTVCSLPVGYYPNDERAADFELKAKEGHSFAHYLFIEQSLRYTKEGGFLFFIIPNDLFEGKESVQLKDFIKDHAYMNALIQLPVSMFKDKKHAKSLFVMQKKKEGLEAPKRMLFANLPSFSQKEAMVGVMRKLDQWFIEEKETKE